MPSTKRTARCALSVSALGLVAAFVIAAAAPAGATPGAVLPAKAKPHGYSLTATAEAVAPFTRSGNDPAHYPDTPFQILSISDVDYQLVGTGILGTGTASFTMPLGTASYVPIFNVNDEPPVLGVFPTTAAQAQPYFFDQAQYGARDFEVVVDGASTPIGADYLAGPVAVAGEAGRHIVTLGAFLQPMSVGTHEVRIRGGVFGDLVDDTYGISFVQEDFTYTVEVVAGS